MNIHHQLLTEYRDHYIDEVERLKRIQKLQDEVQARATQIIIEFAEFEIMQANEELDLYNANQKNL